MAGKYTIRSKEEKLAIDEARLIESLQKLSSYEDLEDVLDIDAVLRYFVVHNFVVNGDSYTGSFQPPSETEAPEDADAASSSSQDIQTASGEDNAARPQRPDDNAAGNPVSTGTDRTQLVLLGTCALALLGGLGFALLFKKRR